jgi:uncharacterized membrane protein
MYSYNYTKNVNRMELKTALKAAITIAAGAIFAALVATATYLFVIPIPATTGYFNLGETIIYVAALVLGPFVGAFAGAGAAIADLIVPGGAVFAPATLVIKSLEGFTVGLVYRKIYRKTRKQTISATISMVLGGVIMILGYFTYEVAALGFPVAGALIEVPFNVIQMTIGLIIAVPITHAVMRVFPQLKSYL